MFFLAPAAPAWCGASVLCRSLRRGEGREIRPQLRCGNASQTSIPPRGGAGPIGAPRAPVKAEARLVRRNGPGNAESEHPNRKAHAPARFRAVREIFIAQMKRDPMTHLQASRRRSARRLLLPLALIGAGALRAQTVPTQL